jgi:hypothetical protein
MSIGSVRPVGHDDRTIRGEERIGAWRREDCPNHAVEAIADELAVDHLLDEHGGCATSRIGRSTQLEFFECIWVGDESRCRIIIFKVSFGSLNMFGHLAEESPNLLRRTMD